MSAPGEWDYPSPYWHGLEPVVTIELPRKWPWEEAMSERVKVPDGMLESAPPPSYSSMNATLAELYCEGCGAAMRRDSGFSDKGPIFGVFVHHETPTCIHSGKRFAAPKVALREITDPDEPIRDLLTDGARASVQDGAAFSGVVREAFRRGQRSAKK